MYLIINKVTRAVECRGDEYCQWNPETQERVEVADLPAWNYFKPVYDDAAGKVIETATQEEITATLNPPAAPTLIDRVSALEAVQLEMILGGEL